MKVTQKTGHVIGATSVSESDDILLLTSANKIIRTPVGSVRNVGRAAQGVTLVDMEPGIQVMGFDVAESETNGDGQPETPAENTTA